MTLRKPYRDFEIEIFNETLYAPNSRDNSKEYKHVYEDRHYEDYIYLTRHSIHILRDEEVLTSALLISSGGTTGIHETFSLIDDNKFLICCAHTIFCLALPDLDLLWHTKADSATCFEIFNYQDGYIVHGELEISRLDKHGSLIWQFGGTDIFVTTNRYGDFEVKGSLIIAKNWDGLEYTVDIETGQAISVTASNQVDKTAGNIALALWRLDE